jgi:hypothetical protein
MPNPGFEPGLSEPQSEVLTTIRIEHFIPLFIKILLIIIRNSNK